MPLAENPSNGEFALWVNGYQAGLGKFSHFLSVKIPRIIAKVDDSDKE